VRGTLRKYRSVLSNREPHPHPLAGREREFETDGTSETAH
jgi:hypothetical protein